MKLQLTSCSTPLTAFAGLLRISSGAVCFANFTAPSLMLAAGYAGVKPFLDCGNFLFSVFPKSSCENP